MNIKAINKLCTINEVVKMIQNNNILVIAGNESALNQLPAGNWIGGTIPYFMDVNGGTFTKEKLFVTDVTDIQKDFKIRIYDPSNLNNLLADRYVDGFTYILIPAFSEIHQKYAIGAEETDGLYDAPIVGWITGIDLGELGKNTPKVIDGKNKVVSDNKAVCLHIELPEGKMANLEILNIFQQGRGDAIQFKEEGFSCKTCLVNGKEVNFAEFLLSNSIDIRFPLVADYAGAMINISFQDVNKDTKEVKFYAPVRKGVEYKLAQPVKDYVSDFMKIVPGQVESGDIVMSCNCILNYLYSELENKKTGGMTGPITFGEIAYVLVNQTMVYLSVV